MSLPVIKIMTYVLDDQEMVLQLIGQAFKKAGITDYRLFSNENEFLEGINDNVHIAVVDYLMDSKEITGIEICKLLLERNPRCYVIIMSGQGSIEVVIDMMNSGAKKYVPKWRPNYAILVAEFVNEAAEIIKRDMEYYTLLVNKAKAFKESTDDIPADRHE